MGLNWGGIIGGIVGAMIPGAGPMAAALGAGLGAKAGGASNKEALMYGLGGAMLGPSAGKGIAGLMGGGAGGAGLFGGGKGIGNALLLSSLASGAIGIGNPPEGLSREEVDKQLSAQWNSLDTGESSDFVDPETGARYSSKEERDAAMEARGSTYNQAQYRPAELAPLYGDTTYAATGGYIQGPGTGTSDSIPAMIYQNGGPVRKAALSDGEFVMTEAAVKGMGGGDRELGAARMYQMMDQLQKRRRS